MRFLLIPALCGAMAAGLCAQGFRGGGRGRGAVQVPTRSTTFGAPQLPPGTALNGVPGLQNGATLNGLPAFSNGYYNFGCFNCSTSGARSRSRAPFVGFVPLFNGYAFPDVYAEQEMGPPPPPPVDPGAMALADEVNRLRGDINQLRSEAQAHAAPPAPEPAAPAVVEPPAPATVIVMRNGTQVESTNYAVMDGTLWNFSARPVQKIPLNSIDLRASEKANSARGIDFSLPSDSESN